MSFLNQEDFKEWIYSKLLYIFLITLVLGSALSFLVYKNYLKSECALSFTPQEEKPQEEIVLEVSGAVEKPGLYKLSSDSRIGEAISLAGGFSKDASIHWITKYLNLSDHVTDAQKIYIPFLSDTYEDPTYELKPLVFESTSSSKTNPFSTSNPTQSGKISVNTATLEELDSLPGVGPSYAQKIIDNRPYVDVDELGDKAGLSESLIEKIKDLIVF